MIRRTILIAIAVNLLTMVSSLCAAPSDKAGRIIPSHYIVVFKDNIDTDVTANKFLKRFNGLKVNLRYRHALRGMAVKMPERLLAKIAADPNVVYIEPDVTVSLNAQTLPRGINRINAELDATANIDGIDDRVDVDIAILDTGIDLDHPDLNVFSYTYCKTQGPINANCIDNDSAANDVNSHGTHVAGIAAALDNTSGVVGVAPGARLWAIKVLEDDGTGAVSQILAGVDYVTAHANEIEVANLSLTGEGTFQSLDDAIDGAVSAGVVFTLAAGNDHIDVSQVFPAGHPNAITVSAFEDYDGIAGGLSGNAEDDTFANFSNYGVDVDIMAPGVSIRSTIPDGNYGNKNGTSMASPHVAGAAALYIVQNPGATPVAVKAALISTGDLTPCANTVDGICSVKDLDGIQEPLLLLTCDDTDLDGVCDDADNCPLDANLLQIDTDFDTAGDACDDDDDNDGLLDTFETAIGSDSLLVDSDGDTISDYDEVAFDGDPNNYDPANDLNPTSSDTDNDSLADNIDPAPLDFNFNDGDLAPLGSPDGQVNAADYLIAQRIVLGEIVADSLQLSHGDLYPAGSPDGVINASDLILLLQLVQ
ncbi:MAG: S8 family serine peptidase [Gammaproteobacteria bacterium]|nr:S8 family serine peptidase [Gammaproteobacteria bacterium]